VAKKKKAEVTAQLKPARFLDPKSDLVFKKIFGNHPDLLKSFLNGILPLSDDHLIDTLTYLPSEQVPRIPSLKNTIVDVKCTDQLGRSFIVEMQLNWTLSFAKRLLFGTSKAYVQQIFKGDDYIELCPVYGLAIINEKFDPTEEWFHHYRLLNVKDSHKVLKGMELIFLELPKFKPQTLEHRKMGVLWLRFLKEINEQVVDVPREFLQSPDLCKALEMAQESAYSKAELESYDKFWDAVSREKTIQNDAKREGIAIGEERGIAIGEERGIAIGEERGEKKLAKKLIEQGVDLQLIIAATGLSSKEILS